MAILTNSQKIKNRLKEVMLNDRLGKIETLLTVVKSDAEQLLSNYMVLEKGEIDVIMEEKLDGTYELSIVAKTKRLIDVGKMISNTN